MPVAGGVAVLVASGIALAFSAFTFPDISAALTEVPQRSISLLVAAIAIVAVGVADDRFNLHHRFKLLGQLCSVLVLVLYGDFVIEKISLLGWAVEMGTLAYPFTIFWFLACVNALNLIDGMDGLLGTVGLIALLTLAVIATITGTCSRRRRLWPCLARCSASCGTTFLPLPFTWEMPEVCSLAS